MQPEIYSIRKITDAVLRGQFRIPAFQRGYVWEPDRVAYLMDSIYKGFPFGSLLFWRTREKLRTERDLGPFKLPEPQHGYAVDYVLDGQQRITSIFGVFQSELSHTNNMPWLDIYYDVHANESAQDTQFFALSQKDVDPNRHFPINTLFDSVRYRRATDAFDSNLLSKLDKLQEKFKEAAIPAQVVVTENKATVAIIFERVNRQGVPLDTLQLLTAWTWSDEFRSSEFHLQNQFDALAEQLAAHSFEGLSEETNLLLRCCSAILKGDASPAAVMELNGQVVRERFEEVENGVKGAVDHLRREYRVESLRNLPFPTLLVPLSVFYAAKGSKQVAPTAEQRQTMNRWFWRAAFSRRYSDGPIRPLQADITEMLKLKRQEQNQLGDFQVTIGPEFFLSTDFHMGNVNTKTFILLLASECPLSFASGAPVDLSAKLKAANRTEFHHLMPKAFLQSSKQTAISDSVLANMCFLSRDDNRKLGGVAPSQYASYLPANHTEILRRAFCPVSLFQDKYAPFVQERAQLLAQTARRLCEVQEPAGPNVAKSE